MERKLGAVWASSSDPTEISNRVKGIVLALSSVIILIAAQVFHLQLTATDITSLAGEVGAVAGAIWTVWGFILAAIRFFGSKPIS